YPENKEQAVAALYAYIYAVDKYEGLICIGAGTLLDGNPLNNSLKRDVTYNPDGVLCGARAITIVGEYAYISADAGLVVVHLKDPTKPEVTAVLSHEQRIVHPHAVACQFRYAYVCDKEGIKILDITDLAHPRPVSMLPLEEAHNIYLARTYAYVAAGKKGLVILDIENAERPRVDQVFNAGGCINDAHDIKLGITYVSEFAYVADGKNGLRVVQLTSPETPGNYGFSPRPTPQLIATYPAPEGSHFLSLSKGIDRDRAVDESGNQIAVFGRVGARPFNLEEQHKMYLRNGKVWSVSDDPQDAQLYRRISTPPVLQER
ncbi:MAG: LVIVD repeat-containing protein, partial [Gemmataceae bacterium]